MATTYDITIVAGDTYNGAKGFDIYTRNKSGTLEPNIIVS